MAKIKVEMDLEDFGAELDYPFEQCLKEEVLYVVKDAVRKFLAAESEKLIKQWVKTEFLQEGKCKVKDGVVYIPLMLKDIQHGK